MPDDSGQNSPEFTKLSNGISGDSSGAKCQTWVIIYKTYFGYDDYFIGFLICNAVFIIPAVLNFLLFVKCGRIAQAIDSRNFEAARKMNFNYMIMAILIGNILSFIAMLMANGKLKSLQARPLPQQYAYGIPSSSGTNQYNTPHQENFTYPQPSSSYTPEPMQPPPEPPRNPMPHYQNSVSESPYPVFPDYAPQSDTTEVRILDDAIRLILPTYIDAGSSAEIIVELSNKSDRMITDVYLDFSNFEEDFEIKGSVSVKTLGPGKELEQRVVIKPRYERGIFPVKLLVMGNGVTIEREYTIKVGGTDIY